MRLGVRRSTVTTVFLTVLGALLVGVPSALLALRDYPLYEASVQVRLLADPRIGDEAALGDEGAQAANFIDTELVTLNSSSLRDRIAVRQDDPTLQVTAVRVGRSNVVEITGRSSQPDIDETVQSLLARYIEGRREELDRRILSAGREVDRQLRVANIAIGELAGDDSITAQLRRAALTAELTRLFEQRNTLQLASDASKRLIQVITTGQGGVRQVVNPLRDGVLGALAGGVIGLAVALALNRLRPRVRGLEDLMELAPEVALPTLPRLRGADLAEQAGTAASSYVSALNTGNTGFGRPPLVVVGPTPGCGATFLAVGLAVASARRQPTVLLAAGDALDESAAALLGLHPEERPTRAGGMVSTRFPGLTYAAVIDAGSRDPVQALDRRMADGDLLRIAGAEPVAVVVDAPPLDTSSAALELARQSGRVLLVGGLDRSSASELQLASRSLRRVGATLVGVVLIDARGGRRRRHGR